MVERDGICAGSTALASGGIRHQYANRIGIELTLHVIETLRAIRGRVRRRSPVSPARLPDPRGDGGRAGARARAQPGAAAQPRGGRDAAVAGGDAPALSVSGYRRPARRDLLAARWLRRPVPRHDGHGRAGPRAGRRDSHGHGGDGFVRRSGTRVEGVTTADGRRSTRRSSSSPPARGRRASDGWPGSTCRCARCGARSSSPRRFPSSASPRPRRSSSTPHQGISMRREGAGLLLGIGRRDEAPSFDTAARLEPRPSPWSSAPCAARPRWPTPQLMRGVGRALRDDAGPDRHRERGAGRRGPPRDRGLQRPRLHARAHRGPAHGRADRSTAARPPSTSAPLALGRFARGETNVESLTFT